MREDKLVLESGYYHAKIAQENLIKDSSIPYSIVRATQFFEFDKGIADVSTLRAPTAVRGRSAFAEFLA